MMFLMVSSLEENVGDTYIHLRNGSAYGDGYGFGDGSGGSSEESTCDQGLASQYFGGSDAGFRLYGIMEYEVQR